MDVSVPYGDALSAARVSAIVNDFATGAALMTTLSGSLAKYPGSQHWHFKRPWPRGDPGADGAASDPPRLVFDQEGTARLVERQGGQRTSRDPRSATA
jgi:hypothetical protein